MPKNKKHAIGLCKQPMVVDPSRTILNTVTVYVDDATALTNVDVSLDSKKYHWTPRQGPVRVVSLSDGGTPPITAAAVQISAYCYGHKTRFAYDSSDDLTVTVCYDDGSGGTETDDCTFTDVEYDATSALTINAINHRPGAARGRQARRAARHRRGNA